MMPYACASTSKPCPVCGQRFRVEGVILRTTEVAASADLRIHLRTHPLLTRIRVALSAFMARQRAALGIPER